MGNSIIKIDGKPLEKLIEVVSNGIGTLYRPRAIRKEADAKAYEYKVLEKARIEAEAEADLIRADCLERISARMIGKEIARQNNIDDVVEQAAKELNGCNDIPDQDVNRDWATRFFNIVQDVSDDDMKILWSKVLAGEIKSPNSFSLRTMELLRNLSKEEADSFVKVAQYVLNTGNYFIFTQGNCSMPQFDIDYAQIAKLTEIGLLQSGSFVQKEFYPKKDKELVIPVIYGKSIVIILTIPPYTSTVSIPIISLTQAGVELYRMIETLPNLQYVRTLADYIKQHHASVQVEYSEITRYDGNTVEFKRSTIKL